jgi:hypothetical protein
MIWPTDRYPAIARAMGACFAVVCIFVARRILSRTIDERLAKAERKAAI